MATKYIKVTGPCKWAKINKPDEKYGNWQITVYPDDASLKRIQDSGLQVGPKKDDDGINYTFRRPQRKIIKGEMVEFDKPEFKGTLPDGVFMGNGSVVTVDVAVYDTMKGKGHTLMSVKLEKLVEFKPDETIHSGSTKEEFKSIASV